MIQYNNKIIEQYNVGDIAGRDSNWEIQIDDIAIVAGASIMMGDEDVFVVIFVDKNSSIFPVTATLSVDVRNTISDFLKTYFDINYEAIEIEIKNNDRPLVYYPESLQGTKLYQFNLFDGIKRILDIKHFASGILSEKIKQYLNQLQ